MNQTLAKILTRFATDETNYTQLDDHNGAYELILDGRIDISKDEALDLVDYFEEHGVEG